MKTGGSGAMFNTGAAARGGSPHKFGDQRYASSSCGAGVFETSARARRPDAARAALRPQRSRPRAPTRGARPTRAAAARTRTRNRDARRSLIDGVEGGPSKPCEAPVAATLVLKDGQRLEGTSFGAKVNRPGEVVFNTGMVGYPEALTDPSYRGQILVLTFPLVGNYGVPSMDTKDKWDLPLYFESDDVQIAGLVVSNYSADPSHWASQQSLGNWLAKAGVPAIFGVDTRALTKGLRERGSILGRLEVEGAPPSPPRPTRSPRPPKVFSSGFGCSPRPMTPPRTPVRSCST